MKPFFIFTKPSEFLQAMIDGLASIESDQRIAMDTYGAVDEGDQICYGCAATWTLQKLAGRKLTMDEVAAGGSSYGRDGLNERAPRICSFESAINQARQGALEPLARFCGLAAGTLDGWDDRWDLQGNSPPDKYDAERIREAIREMDERGL